MTPASRQVRVLALLFACMTLPLVACADVTVRAQGGPPVYTETGIWYTGGSPGYRNGKYRVAGTAGCSAVWRPNLPRAGQYEVIAIFLSGSNRTDDARYTITDARGTSVVTVSQQSPGGGLAERSLGRFAFDAGNGGSVRLDSVSPGKACIADTIVFRSGTNDPPAISAGAPPRRVLKSAGATLTASVSDDDIASAAVVYSASPEEAVRILPALDDGAHGDGERSDGVYGSTIPPVPEGTKVSYRFHAWDKAGQESASPVQAYTVSPDTFPEYRSLWVASWGKGFLDRAQADDLVATCRAGNINTIMPEVRKTCDAYYNSALEPRGNNIGGGDSYDPLGYVIQAARNTAGGAKRLHVHAWFCVNRASDSQKLPPGHILLQHPEYECLKHDGTTTGQRFLDPGHPGAVDYNVSVILDCAGKYDLDGVHLDYIRYPGSEQWGYNPTSVARFSSLYGRTGVPAPDDEAWSDWRRECLTLQLRKIYVKLWKLRPGIVVSCATFSYGDPSDFRKSPAYRLAFQDWAGWLHQGIMDYNCIMNYCDETQMPRFRQWVDRSLAEDVRRGSICGIGLTNTASVQGAIDQLLHVRSRGAAGMNMFSWYGEVLKNKRGEKRADFYAALRAKAFTDWVEPPEAEWKKNPAGGIVEGNVSLDGLPLDHASVWIGGRPETRTFADGSGWYGILDVPPGNHAVHFARPGCIDVVAPCTVGKAGEVLTVNATLARGAQ